MTIHEIILRVSKMPAIGPDADVIEAARKYVDDPLHATRIPVPDEIPNSVLFPELKEPHVRPDPA